jgi:phage terminase large subunit
MPRSIEGMIRKAYPSRVQVIPRTKKVDSINAGRVFLSKCFFDEDRCLDGINSLRHYRYKVENGQLKSEPLHDWASDGADAFATLALAQAGPKTDNDRISDRLAAGRAKFLEKTAEVAGSLGWMR